MSFSSGPARVCTTLQFILCFVFFFLCHVYFEQFSLFIHICCARGPKIDLALGYWKWRHRQAFRKIICVCWILSMANAEIRFSVFWLFLKKAVPNLPNKYRKKKKTQLRWHCVSDTFEGYFENWQNWHAASKRCARCYFITNLNNTKSTKNWSVSSFSVYLFFFLPYFSAISVRQLKFNSCTDRFIAILLLPQCFFINTHFLIAAERFDLSYRFSYIWLTVFVINHRMRKQGRWMPNRALAFRKSAFKICDLQLCKQTHYNKLISLITKFNRICSWFFSFRCRPIKEPEKRFEDHGIYVDDGIFVTGKEHSFICCATRLSIVNTIVSDSQK